jgi:hypothetical protein
LQVSSYWFSAVLSEEWIGFLLDFFFCIQSLSLFLGPHLCCFCK